MARIVFEPGGGRPDMGVTRQQLRAILKEAKDSPVRVLGHAPSPIVEVYVGPYYKEPTRHHVAPSGRVLFSEEDTTGEGDWE